MWIGTDTQSPGIFHLRSIWNSVVQNSFFRKIEDLPIFLGPNFLSRKCSSHNWPLGHHVPPPRRRRAAAAAILERPKTKTAFNSKTCFTPTSLLVPGLQLKTSMAAAELSEGRQGASGTGSVERRGRAHYVKIFDLTHQPNRLTKRIDSKV